MAERVRSPSGLSDEQWELVEPALRRNGRWGGPREVDLREVVNALLYLVRMGRQRRTFAGFTSIIVAGDGSAESRTTVE